MSDQFISQVVLKKLKEITDFTDVLNFRNYREVISLVEEVKTHYLKDEVYLIDLIFILWLKLKNPLVYEFVLDEYAFFTSRKDLVAAVFDESTSRKIQAIPIDENTLNKELERIFNTIKNLVSNDLAEYNRLKNLLYFLYNPGEYMTIPLSKEEKEEKEEKDIHWVLRTFYPSGFFERLSHDPDEPGFNFFKDMFYFNLIKFKRLFRLHNIEKHLNLRKYLIIFDEEYKISNIDEFLKKFEENFDELKQRIINYYLKDLHNIKDGDLLNIRDSFIEEILIEIISYKSTEDMEKVKEIYEELKSKIEKDEYIGKYNKEKALSGINKILEEIEEEPAQYHEKIKSLK